MGPPMLKINTTFHKNHRNALLSKMTDGLIFVKSSDEVIRNGDWNYTFRQCSYFLYLTGVVRTNHLLLLDTKTKKAHLFIPDLDEKYRLWTGKQLTKQAAKKIYGVEAAHYLSEFDKILKQLGRKHKTLYALPNTNDFLKHHPTRLNKDFKKLVDAFDLIRSIKDSEEIKLTQKACEITHKAFEAAMRAIAPGKLEWEIQAALEAEYKRNGVIFLAFDSIIPSGQNASILHYVNNDAKLKKGDLLLIDAGCEWQGYAADVTRTFPISGKFATKQKQIYQIVLDAQKQCIAHIKEGAYTPDLHKMTAKNLMSGLVKLGIIKKGFDLNDLYEKEIHRLFFPHGTGHLLGLDVHDVGALKKHNIKNLRTVVKLKAGMIFTVEPGIYFIEAIFDSPQKRKKFAKYINWKKADSYRSVGGVRIEDDVLVTKTGCTNLTHLPKEISDIEKAMKRKGKPC